MIWAMDLNMHTVTYGAPSSKRHFTVPGRDDVGIFIENKQAISYSSRYQVDCVVLHFPETGELLTFSTDKATEVTGAQ